MTSNEAAKAEAESIATRWVPAHMTARQGMVDDIAKALLVERRLVEEAQQRSATWQHNHEDALRSVDEARADAKRNALSNIELRIEVDRLKGELKTMTVMWQALVDNAPKLHGEIKRLKSEAVEMGDARDVAEAQLATHFEESKRLIRELERAESRHLQTIDERDSFEDAVTEAAVALGCEEEWSSVHDHRTCVPNAIAGLKGELAEARRLVVERGDKLTLAIDFIQQVADGGVGPTEARAFLADFAAPPAEQATPEGALRNVMAGRLPWVPAEQAHSTYEDGEGRPAPLNAERLISAKPIKPAEQAQGAGAPKLTEATTTGGTIVTTRRNEPSLLGHCGGCTPENPSTFCNHSSHFPDPVAALAKRVDAIEEWARRQIAEPWFDPERRPAAPPPRATGYRITPALGGIHPAPSNKPEAAEPKTSCVAHEDCNAADRHSRGAANHVHEEPEAAGQGHAFVECLGYDLCMTIGCHFEIGGGKHCGRPEADHAVPPIPEGK